MDPLRERIAAKASATSAARQAFLGLCAACANDHCGDCLESLGIGHVVVECACGCKAVTVVQRAAQA